jgi:hypothetical protein
MPEPTPAAPAFSVPVNEGPHVDWKKELKELITKQAQGVKHVRSSRSLIRNEFKELNT